MDKKYKTITKEDVDNWGIHAISFLVDILNGDYGLNEAREDVLSFREGGYNDKDD